MGNEGLAPSFPIFIFAFVISIRQRQLAAQVSCALVIAVACLLTFGNALPNTFALDDFYRVVDNPGVERLWPPWRHFADPRTMSTLDRIVQYRPLLPLTLSINHAISGNSVVGYRLGNLLFQLIASLLAFALALEFVHHWLRRPLSLRAELIAASAPALLFAVHPVSGIGVNYISARDLLLMQCGLLGALLAYARLRRLGPTTLRWLVVLGLLALSLLAKTNLVVAPLLFLTFDLVVAGDSLRDRAVWLRAARSAAVVAGFFILTRIVLRFSDLQQVVAGDVSMRSYALTQARLHLFHYLPHFWWPYSIRQLPLVHLSSVTDYRAWLGIAFVLLTIGLALRARRTAPVISFCVLTYWILMIPESSVVPLHQLAADYRAYPSSFWLYLGGTLALVNAVRLRTATAVLVAFALYCGAVSTALNRTWRTGESLWLHSAQHGGDAVAHLNLAMSIADRSDPRVRRQLERALELSPNYVLAHINLCLIQLDAGESAAGLRRCEYAVQLEPDWAQSHYWLSSAYRRLGRIREAASASARAAELDAANVEYAYQAGLDAQRVGDWAAALRWADQIAARIANYKEL
ncbi:MAG TPA: hypothetical protein VK864_04060, partial [Longimicrobiales bacterium]|nr:hypothetical protein [Longimicrobiales bacterium]